MHALNSESRNVLCNDLYEYHAVVSLSDICDPSWRSSRDGLIILAYVATVIARIFTSVMVWMYISYNFSK